MLSIKPLSQLVQTTVGAERLRRELLNLLRRWESMDIGIVILASDSDKIIRAKARSHNSVGLKAMRFKIEIIPVGINASNVLFSQERGTF
jgi:Fungal kinase associated-1 domain